MVYATERRQYERLLLCLRSHSQSLFRRAVFFVSQHNAGLLPLPLSTYLAPLVVIANKSLAGSALSAAVLHDSKRRYWGGATPPQSVGGLNITDEAFRDLFRFTKADFEDMLERFREDLPALLPWPQAGPKPHRYPLFVGLLCLVLRLSQKGSMVVYSDFLRMDERRISEAWRACAVSLAGRFGETLLDMKRWAFLSLESQEAFRRYDGFPCEHAAGVIDGKQFTIAKPVNRGFEHYTYNGHKKNNSLMMLTIVSAHGLAIFAGGPFPGRLSDSRAVNYYDVHDKIRDWRAESVALHGPSCNDLHVIGDGGFVTNTEIYCSFFNPARGSPEAQWNTGMHKVRVIVEMFFGNLVKQFPFIGAGKEFKIGCHPYGSVLQSAYLLHNLHTTYQRGSNISSQLHVELPTVEKVFEVMRMQV